MSNVHAEDTTRHVTYYTNKIARLIIKDAYLIATSTTSHYKVLLTIEHCCIKHWGSLRLKLLHMFLNIINDVNFGYDMAILIDIGFSTIKSIPFICSAALHCSHIIELQSVVLSVASSKHCITIHSDINSVSTDMRTENASNRALFSYIINLHGVVPAS
jgi:hypothetical protein